MTNIERECASIGRCTSLVSSIRAGEGPTLAGVRHWCLGCPRAGTVGGVPLCGLQSWVVGYIHGLERGLEDAPRLIVCEDDRVLCQQCYAEGLDEGDLRTWAAGEAWEGECESCGTIRL